MSQTDKSSSTRLRNYEDSDVALEGCSLLVQVEVQQGWVFCKGVLRELQEVQPFVWSLGLHSLSNAVPN